MVVKRYIKANTEKPVLNYITAQWRELGDHTGIVFSVFAEDGEMIFEELFDYEDVDDDAIYDSAIDLAILALSQKYDLTKNAIQVIKDEKIR